MQNIGLKGAKNTRDLGGLRAVGGVVRPGMLFRSGHLHNLTSRDISILRDEMRVRLVIDLRTDMERDEKPDVQIPGIVYQHMPIIDAATVGITHERSSDSKAEILADLPDIRLLYRNVLHDRSLERLAEVIGLITEFAGQDGAILYHCTEGKDRAGIVTLILLWILGVPYAGIMEDYLYTNHATRSRAQRYYWMVRLLKRDKVIAERVRSLFAADPSYLDSACDEARELFGSMDALIEEGLRISPSEQQDFRSRMLLR